MSERIAASPPADPIPVLIVASWYPSAEEVASGRFVADQADALAADGRVTPMVVSFDQVPLVGGATARVRQLGALEPAVAGAIATERHVFQPSGYGETSGVPVARLGIARGMIPAFGSASTAHHRETALVALGGRFGTDLPRPAIIHAHTGYPDGVAAAVLAERLGVPLVITEHAGFLERILADPAQRDRYRGAALRAARIVAVSEILARQIRAALPEVAARVVVIPNAVAVDAFGATPLVDRTADECLYVGYRTEGKGIDTLLNAFAIVRAARPAVRLRLIGRSTSDDEERRWVDQAASLGIAGAVQFEPVADRAAVAWAMAQASVFVHASRSETFGVVVAEALAAGMPVVATDSGAVREMLEPDPDAFGGLVASGDPRGLADAIIRTLENRASFDPDVLRRSIVERYSAPIVANRLVELYEDVLAGGAGRHGASGAMTSTAADRAPAVVVALDRAGAATRLAGLPPDVRTGLSLITAREPASIPIPATAWLAEIDVPPVAAVVADRTRRTGIGVLDRLLRFGRDPLGTIRRRRRPTGLEHAVIAAAARDMAAAAPDATSELVPLDGRDVLVAAAVTRATGRRIRSGGLRSLADEQWSAGLTERASAPSDRP